MLDQRFCAPWRDGGRGWYRRRRGLCRRRAPRRPLAPRADQRAPRPRSRTVPARPRRHVVVCLEVERPPPVDLHSPSSALTLDLQLQQYVRVVNARDRDVERVGPFLASFDRHSTSPFLSYAIPDPGARPAPAEVAALAAAFRRRGRLPRLEFLPGAAPDVEAALLRGGFAVEARLAVMTCGVDEVVALSPAPGITI